MINSIDVGGLKEEHVKLVQEFVEFLRAKDQRHQENAQATDDEVNSLSRQFGVKGELIRPEENIITEMLEQDVVVQMPPKRTYTLNLEVKNIRRGMPSIVEPDGI